jgi:hypothetical protein
MLSRLRVAIQVAWSCFVWASANTLLRNLMAELAAAAYVIA